MDMSPYRDLFISEARRHLESFNNLLVRLEETPDPSCTDELFRHAHSLKGMAATMGFDDIAALAHRMEDLLAGLRNGRHAGTPLLTDLLLEGSDLLAAMVGAVERGDGAARPDARPLLERLAGFSSTATPPPSPPEPPSSSGHQFRHSDSFSTIRIRTDTLDRLVAVTGELITTRHRLAESPDALARSDGDMRRLSQQLRELRDLVFQARMLPFSVVAERFPRLVRDLARERHKEAHLEISGAEIELDRGILEAVAEPLVHLLRNAVDHGLEPPAERSGAGKQGRGLISLRIARDRDRLSITVGDDGRGMDPARLLARARELGMITPEQATALTPDEILMLICAPGFSTAETLTDLSGRGVGMDAVRNVVRGLGGSISIRSALGQGSWFRLDVPLTVSIIQALLVRCGPLTLALPVSAVEQSLELLRHEIEERDGRRFCPARAGRGPLVDLHRFTGHPPPVVPAPYTPVVVCTINGRPTGLAVDGICGQREIFVRPLGRPLSQLKHISGGATLGDGSVVFIVDVNTLA